MTAQIAETLHYEGREHSLCTQPLDCYFKLSGTNPGFEATCTALWRGYVGTWEILDARLYLVGLAGALRDGSAANLSTVFPGFAERVFAHWYRGTLRIPQGSLLNYVHQGYGSTYESDLLLAVDRGVVTGTSTKANGSVGVGERAGKAHRVAGMTVFPRAGGEE